MSIVHPGRRLAAIRRLLVLVAVCAAPPLDAISKGFKVRVVPSGPDVCFLLGSRQSDRFEVNAIVVYAPSGGEVDRPPQSVWLAMATEAFVVSSNECIAYGKDYKFLKTAEPPQKLESGVEYRVFIGTNRGTGVAQFQLRTCVISGGDVECPAN